MKKAPITALCAVLMSSSVAFGQETMAEEAPVPEPTAEAAPAEEPAPAPAAAEEAPAEAKGETSADGADGTRFRFGVAAGLGMMFSSVPTFTYSGVDLRFGAQINDMIAVYAVPQLGYYFTGAEGTFGAGGLAGVSAIVDFTFIDRVFVGGGAGFGVLNNPSGPELHFRAGGYPLMSKSSEKVRRKGLMLGMDLRVHFLEGLTVVAPTLNIGYDAF